MANRWFKPFQALGRELVTVAGSFRPNGSSAISVKTGVGFNVARSDVGVYTITLTDKYATLVCAMAQIQMASATDLNPQWGAIDVSSARTLVLQALSGGTPTEIASNAANWVHFMLVLKNSKVSG